MPTWLPWLPSLIPVIPEAMPTRLFALRIQRAWTSPPPFRATIVLVSVAVVPRETYRPPPLSSAVLPLTVQSVSDSVP